MVLLYAIPIKFYDKNSVILSESVTLMSVESIYISSGMKRVSVYYTVFYSSNLRRHEVCGCGYEAGGNVW
jgi:hypothetical protein